MRGGLKRELPLAYMRLCDPSFTPNPPENSLRWVIILPWAGGHANHAPCAIVFSILRTAQASDTPASAKPSWIASGLGEGGLPVLIERFVDKGLISAPSVSQALCEFGGNPPAQTGIGQRERQAAAE